MSPAPDAVRSRRPAPGAGAALLAVLLAGCVYMPYTTERYDADCQIVARQMHMTPVQVASIGGCANTGCAALLAAAGVVAAASAVVSGSITIAGNAVYWLEKQGRCIRAG